MPQQKPTISSSQLLILLLLARVMHTMIFRFDSFSSGVPVMAALLISTAVEAVICLPAVVYYSSGGKNLIGELGPLSRVAGFLYSFYFTVIAGGTAALFAEFLQREFYTSVTPVAAIILLAAASAYCAYMGIEGLARAGAVVFWSFIGLFAVMCIVNEGGFNWLNLRPLTSLDIKSIFSYSIESLSSSWWIPMLVILGEHLKSGAFKAAYGYLFAKLIIIETLVLLITIVLWRYIGVLGYPIYALGAYAKSDFIQRFDAINMLVWAINCALVLSLYVFISQKPAQNRKIGVIIFSALFASVAVYEFKRGLRYNEPWFLWFKLSGIFLLGILIPIAAIILKKRKERPARI